MKRARPESQQQQPLAKRQKREARVAADAAASPTGHSKLSSSALRAQQGHRRRRAAGSADTQRHKRRSFGSDGSGSSALGGSEGTATSTSSPSRSPSLVATANSDDSLGTQRAWYVRVYGEPDAVLHVGGCSFGVHLSVLQRECPSLFAKIAALHGQWVPDSEHGDSSHTLLGDGDDHSSGSGSSSSGAITALPSFALRLVDGERYLSGAALGSEIALSSARVRCPLAMAAAENTVATRPAWVKRRAGDAETPFASVRCLAHTSPRSCSSVASRSDSSETLASPLGSISAATAVATTAATDEQLDARAAKAQRGRGNFSAAMVAGAAGFASAGAEREPSPPRRRAERVFALPAGKENRAENRQSAALEPSPPLAPLQPPASVREDAKQDDDEAIATASPSASARHLELVQSPASERNDGSSVLLHVEWRAAEPTAVASVLEFLYTGEMRLVDVSCAEHVVPLCRWLALTDTELFYTCLSLAIDRAALAQWMPLLLIAARVRDRARRRALLDKLLEFLRTSAAHERAADVLASVQLEHLAALRDVILLTRVATRVFNCVRHVGVWRNVLVGLNLWTRRTFERTRSLSLLELHRQFAPWEPFVALPGVQISGEAHYVRPTTLFRFGAFAFQVRFEVDSLVLIQWRVVRDSAAGDDGTDDPDANPNDDDNPNAARDVDPRDPPFALRGEMRVLFSCARGAPTHEQVMSLSYTHDATECGVWKPLVQSSSASARLIPVLELRAARSEEGLPSQSQSEVVISGTASQSEISGAGEYLRAKFSGRFFVWGHQLCNLYHYLSACTQFYSSPRGDVGELVRLDALEKMQRMPLDTLLLVLQSDRLRIPGGETMLLQVLSALCFRGTGTSTGTGTSAVAMGAAGAFGTGSHRTDFRAGGVVRALFGCVRWCFADLSRILTTLECAPREYMLYELIQRGLRDPLLRFPRRVPYGEDRTPYLAVTSLVEFEIEAGDRGLSPDGGCFSQESIDNTP